MTNVIQQDFQTVTTDFPGLPGLLPLNGTVTAIALTDPTEGNERTSQIEVGDAFDVRVDWSFQPSVLVSILGGIWIVTLFSDNIDGVGTLVGPLTAPNLVNAIGGQLAYTTTFTLGPLNATQQGVYQFAVTINHSTNGTPSRITEMIAFAESSPFQVIATPAEGD